MKKTSDLLMKDRASQVALVVKNLSTNAGDIRDTGSRSGRSPEGGHGNPFQFSCLENPMDRGAWQTTVHGVAKSWTRLKQLSTQAKKANAVFAHLSREQSIQNCPGFLV